MAFFGIRLIMISMIPLFTFCTLSWFQRSVLSRPNAGSYLYCGHVQWDR